MRGVRWGRVVVVVAIGVAAVVGAPAVTDASPAAVGPPDSPTTQVTATVHASCGGGPAADFPMVVTVPTEVRAGRPFPVQVASDQLPMRSGTAGYVRLSVGGGTTTEATIATGGTGYLVAAWTPRQQLTLAVTGFGFTDTVQFIGGACTAETPAALPPIPVRHATPFDAAQLTAGARVAILCQTFPHNIPSFFTQDVSVTVPNQAHVGEPFTVEGSAFIVRGGTRSGQTVTPTGDVGDTVDFSYSGSFTQFLPPPFPPIPSLICDQQGGEVDLASVPIVAR